MLSLCHACAGAPACAVRNLFEIGAGNERLRQILWIFHHRGHGEPRVAIVLFMQIVIFLEHRVLAIRRTVLAQISSAQLRCHHLERASVRTFASCAQAESRGSRTTHRPLPIRGGVSLPSFLASLWRLACEMKQTRLRTGVGLYFECVLIDPTNVDASST